MPAAERVQAIDILRGLALFGIIAANMRGFAGPAAAYMLTPLMWPALPDRLAQAAWDLFYEKRRLQKLIDNFFAPEGGVKDGEKIKINTVIAKAALVYEKIRNAVDYQEDHLVRKNAIHRILKRKLVYEKLVMENYLLAALK